MAFATLNGVNAARGMQGTQRTQTTGFNGAPVGVAPYGMSGGEFPTPNPAPNNGTVDYGASASPVPNHPPGAAPMGASYSRANGMMNSRAGLYSVNSAPDAHGIVGGQQQMANVGPAPQQMSAAEMQDPANAALAGYAFSATQDRAPSASTNPAARPPAAAPQTPQTATVDYGASAQKRMMQ